MHGINSLKVVTTVLTREHDTVPCPEPKEFSPHSHSNVKDGVNSF